MKKVFIMAMAFAAMTFSACNNNANNVADDENREVVIDEQSLTEHFDELEAGLEVEDEEAVMSTVEAIKQKIAQYVANGEDVQARVWSERLRDFVTANREKLDNLSSELLENVHQKVAEDVSAKAEELKTGAEEVRDAVVEDAKQAVDNAKQTAETTVQNAEDAAKNVVDDAKQKAADALDKANADVKGKLGL